MKLLTREAKGYLISLGVHLAVLIPLTFVTFVIEKADLKVAIETLFAEERPAEDFTRELSLETQVSESLNVQDVGGSVSGAIGGGGSGGGGGGSGAQAKIDGSEQLKDAQVVVNVGAIEGPGTDSLGSDLGEGEVTGEVGAAVEGYGPAMSRMGQEIIRMMREQRVLVVWLFDESESMEDDRQFIKESFRQIYEELGIAAKKDNTIKSQQDLLLTAVMSFGKEINPILDKPTDDEKLIQSAIDKVKNDPSGKEMTLTAINVAMEKFRKQANAQKRKLAIIVVTDESGDDDADSSDALDKTIANCKRSKTPIYMLGREAIFGYPYARINWKDPELGLDYWLTINRGPETPDPECLQFDGFHERHDAYPSGFGPYTQARLCKETGGIFFILPSEEQNLIGQAAIEKRKFAFLDLKEYNPELVPRREYRQERDKSKFRDTIWQVIKTLNPHLDKELQIRDWHFPAEQAKFQADAAIHAKRAIRAMALLSQALTELEKVKPLRDKEESQRWRAHYDLITAQLMGYRVRLFQYLLALDQMVRTKQTPKDPKHNEWGCARVPQMLPPTEEQMKLTKVTADELKEQESKARAQYDFVIKTHPRTPWSNRAELELNQGFGVNFVSFFRDQRYYGRNIKLPTL